MTERVTETAKLQEREIKTKAAQIRKTQETERQRGRGRGTFSLTREKVQEDLRDPPPQSGQRNSLMNGHPSEEAQSSLESRGCGAFSVYFHTCLRAQ